MHGNVLLVSFVIITPSITVVSHLRPSHAFLCWERASLPPHSALLCLVSYSSFIQLLILQGLESLSWARPGKSPPFPASGSPSPWVTLRHSPYPLDVPELWAPCQQEWGLPRPWMLRSRLSVGFRAGTSWSFSCKSLPAHFEHFAVPYWVLCVCVWGGCVVFRPCPVACGMWDLSSLIRDWTCPSLTNYFLPCTAPFYLPLATTSLCFVSEDLSYLFLWIESHNM